MCNISDYDTWCKTVQAGNLSYNGQNLELMETNYASDGTVGDFEALTKDDIVNIYKLAL